MRKGPRASAADSLGGAMRAQLCQAIQPTRMSYMVCVPTAIPKPRRTKTQAKKTPAIQRKTNANHVNGSPGLPAWWARAKSKAEPVTASALARDLRRLQEAQRSRTAPGPASAETASPRRPRRQGSRSRKRRTDRPRRRIDGQESRSSVCSRYENPKSISRLMPRSSDRPDQALDDHPGQDSGREPPVLKAHDLPGQQDQEEQKRE